MADLKQVRFQHPDLSYTDTLRTYADASLNLTDALPAGTKRRLVDALGRVISEVDEATGEIVRTRHSDGAEGPGHTLVHETAAPSVDDVIGRFAFRSRNDAGALYTGVELRAIVKNAQAGSEEVWFEAGIMNGGTFVPAGLSLRVVAGAVKLFIDGVEAGTGGGGGGGSTAFSGARVYNDSNIIVPNSTFTTPTFNQERWDTDAYHDPGVNPSRLTAPETAYYMIGGNIEWEGNTLGARILRIILNGSTVIGCDGWTSEQPRRVPIITQYLLSEDDYVELQVHQTSGGNLDIHSMGNYSPEFWIHKIGS